MPVWSTGSWSAGRADAAADYAQQIPVRVIAAILGVPAELSDTFTGWVRAVLEFADDEEIRREGTIALIEYFVAEVERRKQHPGDDLLSALLQTEVDGQPIEDSIVLGVAALTLIAGVDTTWSAIGSSLWHLATHPEHAKLLATDPEAMPAGHRGAAAGLLAGDHGPHRDRRGRIRGLPDARRRQGPDELPRRQP